MIIIMNTIFIKIFFSISTLYIFLHCLSFAKYELIDKKNVLGFITSATLSIVSLVFSNIIFWIN